MTRHAHHFPLVLDRDCFTLHSDGELFSSYDRAEIEHVITGLFSAPYTVIVSNPVENRCRDVTDEFAPVEEADEPEPFNGDYAHADHFRQLRAGDF